MSDLWDEAEPIKTSMPDGPGRVFVAQFSGGVTSCCGEEIEAGDHIRADGAGGWEHREDDCW